MGFPKLFRSTIGHTYIYVHICTSFNNQIIINSFLIYVPNYILNI